MTIRRRLAGAAITVALGVSAVLFSGGTATAANRNVTGTNGPVQSCVDFGYLLCLYWDSNFRGSKWGTNSESADLAGQRFWTSGDGFNTPVKNNAASMACQSQYLLCYSFYNEHFSGDYDYVLPQRGGNLYYTLNDGASVRVF